MEYKDITFQRFVTKEEEGMYLTVPFFLDVDASQMEISYEYDKSNSIIDFGLNDAGGEFIGWSGSNRSSIGISERACSEGFFPVPLKQGEWQVLLGAYKVPQEGVTVTYRVRAAIKELKLLKGDIHMHSRGSDGNLTTGELAFLAEKEGLDYIFITDHNNYAHNYELRSTEHVTLIPGVEWTNYRGHAGMLGLKRPFQDFMANSQEKAKEILAKARDAGALVVLNHPFCLDCGWRWGMDFMEYDLVEVWNGGLSIERNHKCLEWWDLQLKAGRKIPVTGGSDFHIIREGSMPGLPCTCVYAMSNSADDILDALKRGRSFLSISPQGPVMTMESSRYLPGDEVEADSSIALLFSNLKKDDTIHLIWADGEEEIICEENTMKVVRCIPDKKYYRVEIRRRLWPGTQRVPVLISNPFYTRGE